jgi:ligand-binding sensor domain-containing protein
MIAGIPHGSHRGDPRLGRRPEAKVVLIILLLLLCIQPLHPQKKLLPVFHFQHIGGLSSVISHVVRDSFGFIWIGTDHGLERYDGYEMKEYRNDPDDPHSLASHRVWNTDVYSAKHAACMRTIDRLTYI